jgi:hypothetical protein
VKKLWVAAGAAGVLVALSGCGNGFADESAEAITDAAATDMQDAKSLRMSGDLTNDGEEISIDLSMNTDGDCEGSIGVQGGTAEIISLDDQSWFKPDEAFWNNFAGPQAEQIISMVGDKWVVLPSDDDQFATFCDLDELLEEFDESDDDKKVEKGETEEVDGQEAIIIEGESDEGDPIKAWIATDDPHYILKMEVTSGDEPGEISFSDFDEDLDIEAPADDEVIDLNNLG